MRRELCEFFFGKRWTPLKWITILPGLIALVFVGHAFEDAGLFGALPYMAIISISVAYLFRPMVIIWVALFGSFAFYAGLIAIYSDQGFLSEGFLIGLVPAISMLFAWPMKLDERKEA